MGGSALSKIYENCLRQVPEDVNGRDVVEIQLGCIQNWCEYWRSHAPRFLGLAIPKHV